MNTILLSIACLVFLSLNVIVLLANRNTLLASEKARLEYSILSKKFDNYVNQMRANNYAKKWAIAAATRQFEDYKRNGRTSSGAKNEFFSPNGRIHEMPVIFDSELCDYNDRGHNEYLGMITRFYKEMVTEYESTHPYTT